MYLLLFYSKYEERMEIIGVYSTWEDAYKKLEKEYDFAIHDCWDDTEPKDIYSELYNDGTAFAEYMDDRFFWEIKQLNIEEIKYDGIRIL